MAIELMDCELRVHTRFLPICGVTDMIVGGPGPYNHRLQYPSYSCLHSLICMHGLTLDLQPLQRPQCGWPTPLGSQPSARATINFMSMLARGSTEPKYHHLDDVVVSLVCSLTSTLSHIASVFTK